MKVRPSVKPMCDKCKVIKRNGKVMVGKSTPAIRAILIYFLPFYIFVTYIKTALNPRPCIRNVSGEFKRNCFLCRKRRKSFGIIPKSLKTRALTPIRE